MPYKIIGNSVYHLKGGKWKRKQTCGSSAAAKKAISLLRGLESGSIKKSEVGKGKFSKKRRKKGKKK